MARGEDPSELKKERKREADALRAVTFAAQADAFVRKSRAEGRAEATMAKTEWLLDMAKADFGKKPIREVAAPTILQCLRKVEAKGSYETAKRLQSKIGAVFRFEVANSAADVDPTYALRDALIRPTVKPRAATTDSEALGGLMRAIYGFHGQVTTRIALQLLAMLVPRPGELRQARWSEVELKAADWASRCPRRRSTAYFARSKPSFCGLPGNPATSRAFPIRMLSTST